MKRKRLPVSLNKRSANVTKNVTVHRQSGNVSQGAKKPISSVRVTFAKFQGISVRAEVLTKNAESTNIRR